MIKCAVCVMHSLKGKDHSTAEPVQQGVDGAKTAVVTIDGQSLCVEHLHERLTFGAMQEYLADVERQVSGRR